MGGEFDETSKFEITSRDLASGSGEEEDRVRPTDEHPDADTTAVRAEPEESLVTSTRHKPEDGIVSDADIPLAADPLAIAAEQGWMTESMAADLSAKSDGDSRVAVRRALETGLISAREYDIVAALSGLREVAPGYAVNGLLGRGGMGAVYRAEQKNLQRPVALKTILVDAEANGEAVTRFEREAKTIAKLRHPNIITAYDFGRHAGRLYLAMELVDGQDLDSRLQAGQLSESMAWSIARQIAAALLAAEKLGVTHRDIKPANVLLVPPPEGSPLPEGVPLVKVADFGLAFLADAAGSERVTSVNVAVGSPHYMAPELLSGSDASASSDLYALGATVFRMLSEKPPFWGRPLPALISDKLSGEVPMVRGVSPESQILIGRMMSPDPDERPPGFAELIAEIDQIISVAGASPHDSSLPIEARRGTRRMPAWQRVALIAVGAGLIAGAVALLEWGRPSPEDVDTLRAQDVRSVELLPSAFSLFDGKSLSGWDSGRGVWKHEIGMRDFPVIAGRPLRNESDALLYRDIGPIVSNGAGGHPMAYFRIEATVDRAALASAACQFNLTASESPTNDGVRYELCVGPEEVSIKSHRGMERAANVINPDGPDSDRKTLFSQPVSSDERATSAAAPATIAIDLIPTNGRSKDDSRAWRVWLDGQVIGDPLPVLPATDGGGFYPTIALRAAGGRVEFYDLSIRQVVESRSMP